MTRLEELKAAWAAAYGTSEAAYARYTIACDDADAAWDATWAAERAAAATYDAAYEAYQAELKKTKEQTND